MQYRIKHFLGTLPAASITEEKKRLASLLDVSVAQLNRIAREDSDPSGTQLRIIADFFKITVDELYEEAAELAASP